MMDDDDTTDQYEAAAALLRIARSANDSSRDMFPIQEEDEQSSDSTIIETTDAADADTEEMTGVEHNANNLFRFEVGQKVLCFHQESLYEAEVKDQVIDNDEPYYLVHYEGWNRRWDEWVDEYRVVEYTEKALKLKKELEKIRDPQTVKTPVRKNPKRKARRY